MTKYQQLRINPPVLSVKPDITEMKIHMISCMCDNKHLISLSKTDNGFKLCTGIQAYSNFQMKCDKYEIEWAADELNWKEVFRFINSGTETIEKIVCR